MQFSDKFPQYSLEKPHHCCCIPLAVGGLSLIIKDGMKAFGNSESAS